MHLKFPRGKMSSRMLALHLPACVCLGLLACMQTACGMAALPHVCCPHTNAVYPKGANRVGWKPNKDDGVDIVSCIDGWEDCDGNFGNGCESETFKGCPCASPAFMGSDYDVCSPGYCGPDCSPARWFMYSAGGSLDPGAPADRKRPVCDVCPFRHGAPDFATSVVQCADVIPPLWLVRACPACMAA